MFQRMKSLLTFHNRPSAAWQKMPVQLRRFLYATFVVEGVLCAYLLKSVASPLFHLSMLLPGAFLQHQVSFAQFSLIASVYLTVAAIGIIGIGAVLLRKNYEKSMMRYAVIREVRQSHARIRTRRNMNRR
ncbi:hypothetical protein BJI49_10435 [Acetobacter pasteurianus]|uniref:Uncharacterized protein n=1 Tax=Acetobacter pasteurianus TaxID=438 RepID=A0A1A0D7T0_ACEPA|nr:hypothetical protein [Acetobacter pasteurianus]OAZ70871.1 hypothetical protein SRCM100623_02223 [Acetobacter pasteurianus]RCL05526.1 hypothetical protein BJI49_10435 [Acetobacter pasteurianus]GAB30113.1 hypothetical protein APS_0715 [Acetobacter pasteurianus subsp. pasteurianus LMG 1262 = NBRC 106471]GCD48923.1 hypothetical protein NBRC106471_0479 [Acetobacter pasteurianus subsp. pasteurianus LMG 1262 = NBRC 106471]